jgi:hypothetical protein
MHISTYAIIGKDTEIKVRALESSLTLEFDYTSTFYIKDLETAKNILAAAYDLLAKAHSMFPSAE